MPKTITDEGALHLSQAIVALAMRDYESALTVAFRSGREHTNRTQTLERFFKSSACAAWCQVSGEWLIKTMRERAAKKRPFWENPWR